MSPRRPPLAQRTAYIMAGLTLALVSLAAFVSRSESREDFIIRMEAGDFQFNAPDINPPNFNGPDVNGPDIQGPNINAPDITFWDVLWDLFLIALSIGLIVALVMAVRRYGPGSSSDGADERTTRLQRNQPRGSNGDGDRGWGAFEQFCYALLKDPDPSRAIRVAMRYAEGGFGRLDPRRTDQTPNEWMRRVGEGQADLGPDLRILTQSYNSVRFADATARARERDDAVDALRRLARSACGRDAPSAPAAAGQL